MKPQLRDMLAGIRSVSRGDDPTDPSGIALKKDYSAEERKTMAKAGQALPDGSYPIKDKEDLKDAVASYGRAKDKDAAKKHIMKRARALGAMDLLPDDWKKGMETPPQRERAVACGIEVKAEVEAPSENIDYAGESGRWGDWTHFRYFVPADATTETVGELTTQLFTDTQYNHIEKVLIGTRLQHALAQAQLASAQGQPTPSSSPRVKQSVDFQSTVSDLLEQAKYDALSSVNYALLRSLSEGYGEPADLTDDEVSQLVEAHGQAIKDLWAKFPDIEGKTAALRAAMDLYAKAEVGSILVRKDQTNYAQAAHDHLAKMATVNCLAGNLPGGTGADDLSDEITKRFKGLGLSDEQIEGLKALIPPGTQPVPSGTDTDDLASLRQQVTSLTAEQARLRSELKTAQDAAIDRETELEDHQTRTKALQEQLDRATQELTDTSEALVVKSAELDGVLRKRRDDPLTYRPDVAIGFTPDGVLLPERPTVKARPVTTRDFLEASK